MERLRSSCCALFVEVNVIFTECLPTLSDILIHATIKIIFTGKCHVSIILLRSPESHSLPQQCVHKNCLYFFEESERIFKALRSPIFVLLAAFPLLA